MDTSRKAAKMPTCGRCGQKDSDHCKEDFHELPIHTREREREREREDEPNKQ